MTSLLGLTGVTAFDHFICFLSTVHLSSLLPFPEAREAPNPIAYGNA